jgi:hypothetical protein
MGVEFARSDGIFQATDLQRGRGAGARSIAALNQRNIQSFNLQILSVFERTFP